MQTHGTHVSGTSACGAETPRVKKSVPSHVCRKHESVILEVSSGISTTGNLSEYVKQERAQEHPWKIPGGQLERGSQALFGLALVQSPRESSSQAAG